MMIEKKTAVGVQGTGSYLKINTEKRWENAIIRVKLNKVHKVLKI